MPEITLSTEQKIITAIIVVAIVVYVGYRFFKMLDEKMD